MSVQDVIRLCQHEQSVNDYTERIIIIGLQCINTSLQRWMHIWEFSGTKTIGTGLQRSGKSDMVRWVILHHILNKWVSTDLNAWPLQWRGPVALLCCRGYFAGMVWVHLSPYCPLIEKGKLQIHTKLFCMITFILRWNRSDETGVRFKMAASIC